MATNDKYDESNAQGGSPPSGPQDGSPKSPPYGVQEGAAAQPEDTDSDIEVLIPCCGRRDRFQVVDVPTESRSAPARLMIDPYITPPFWWGPDGWIFPFTSMSDRLRKEKLNNPPTPPPPEEEDESDSTYSHSPPEDPNTSPFFPFDEDEFKNSGS